MKKWIWLFRREFSLHLWQYSLPGLAALVIQPVMTAIGAQKVWPVPIFSVLYQEAAVPAAVVVLLALSAGGMVYAGLRDFRGGMDCLLTLPQRREWIYLAKMAAFGAHLLILAAGLLGGVFLSWAVYLHALTPDAEPLFNELLLAFCENPTLRVLFPLDTGGTVSTLLLGVSMAVMMEDLALTVRNRKLWSVPVLLGAGICWVETVWFRLHETGIMNFRWEKFGWPLGLAVSAVLLVWHSLYLLKKADFS